MKTHKKIIIFGASIAGIRTYEFLKELTDRKIDFFVDNDEKKWNTKIKECSILNPRKLIDIKKEDYIVIIGSMYAEEISKQLKEYGYTEKVDFFNNYEFLYLLTEEYFLKNKTDFDQFLNCKNEYIRNQKYNYGIVLPRGHALGGLEIWSYNLHNALKKLNTKAFLINMMPNKKNDKYNECEVRTNKKFINCLKEIMKIIVENSPMVIIPNTSNYVLIATTLLKKYYPNIKTKVLAVIHSDLLSSFRQYEFFEEYIDRFLCVSDEIEKNLIKVLPNRSNNIFSYISPVPYKKFETRKYCKDNFLHIGYAGRLVTVDKRANDIIPFIRKMESYDIKYKLHIAGDGSYRQEIEKFIINNELNDHIILYGIIENENMYEFWSNVDVFINFSEREGTSISMLEALANGTVPVLTKVSGVAKFVDRKNGFIVNPGEIDLMVKHMKFLSTHKNFIEKLGTESIIKIESQCSLKNYAWSITNLF